MGGNYTAYTNAIINFPIINQSNIIYGVDNIIASDNILNSDISFIAGNEILLKPGFESSDNFLAKIDGCVENLPICVEKTKIDLLEKNKIIIVNEDVVIYPNPSETGIFYIKNSDLIDIDNIEVFNYTGKTIALEKHTNEIDLSQYEKGVYFIRIKRQNNFIIKKIVKK